MAVNTGLFRYWVAGKEKRTSLGTYPKIGLKEARDKNIDFRRNLAAGVPAQKSGETFADIAEEYIAKRVTPRLAEGTIKMLRLRLTKTGYPLHSGLFSLKQCYGLLAFVSIHNITVSRTVYGFTPLSRE